MEMVGVEDSSVNPKLSRLARCGSRQPPVAILHSSNKGIDHDNGTVNRCLNNIITTAAIMVRSFAFRGKCD